MSHQFTGKWITDAEFAALEPRNVFHRQLDAVDLPCDAHRNRHILFRRSFHLTEPGRLATMYLSADDSYKLFINGQFVAQGPAPSYHFRYPYNVIDVLPYLQEGDNLIAVHTYYQGLINRVWQSGDNRHGLILDLVIDGQTVVASDEGFLTSPHTAYTELGVCGYDTQFLERYDSNAPEVGFASLDFPDAHWANAQLCQHDDHILMEQTSKMLEWERRAPVAVRVDSNCLVCDFGSNYVGVLWARAVGHCGDVVTIRCAQELNTDGSLRYELRANCTYEEEWVLADGESTLDWFDYKSFRYAELLLPPGAEITELCLLARHYPFQLKASLRPEFSDREELRRIWTLCVHTQQYGVQEVIQDCMEREKGFYLGDGCYTALTHLILTGDDSMVRKLIDDAFATESITDTLVTCLSCSFMQEIAEYPLILVSLVWWHYRYTGDRANLMRQNTKVRRLLDAYRKHYETDGLLRDLDKWCVVEWPKNFQHGYDADIREGQVCHQAHVAINAYYLAAIRTANRIAAALDLPAYREEAPLLAAFQRAFCDARTGLFTDAEDSDHISLVGNSFVYGLGICTEADFQAQFLTRLSESGIESLSLFCTFPVLMRLAIDGRTDLIRECLLREGAWLRMLREGATTTFEAWGKDSKWNTSLFHMTFSYAAVFLADIDLRALFGSI